MSDAIPLGLMRRIWTHHDAEWGEWPVVRITAKLIFIPAEHYWAGRYLRGEPRNSSCREYSLNRVALERDGSLWSHRAWGGTRFYTDAGKAEVERRKIANRFVHYPMLRLSSDATPDEIATAFHTRAKELHPDTGADAEQFRRLVAEKDRALGALGDAP